MREHVLKTNIHLFKPDNFGYHLFADTPGSAHPTMTRDLPGVFAFQGKE